MRTIPLHMDETFVNTAGLMRCCVESLMQLAEDDPKMTYSDGAIVKCRYSRDNSLHKMVLFAGKWSWLKPVESEMEQRDILIKRKHPSVRSIGDV